MTYANNMVLESVILSPQCCCRGELACKGGARRARPREASLCLPPTPHMARHNSRWGFLGVQYSLYPNPDTLDCATFVLGNAWRKQMREPVRLEQPKIVSLAIIPESSHPGSYLILLTRFYNAQYQVPGLRLTHSPDYHRRKHRQSGWMH